MRSLATAFAIAVAMSAGTALTVPKPAEIPRHWQIDATFGELLPIQVKLPSESLPRTFWYIRYKVTNNTGQDRVFIPEFILYTDTGQVIRAGEKVPAEVFHAIKELYGDPLLLDAASVAGKLLQGADNAKEGVAVWTDFDPQAASFDVFVSGLSGETMELELPRPVRTVETDAFGNRIEVVKTKILLAKTLQRHYVVPGEASTRATMGVKFTDEEWVMR